MDVGVQMVFASYGWSGVSDQQVWDEELRLARQAADLGFDVLWSVEHHFNDYSFCPDNLQLMSYLAAECRDVGLGTAAVPTSTLGQTAVRYDMSCRLSGQNE